MKQKKEILSSGELSIFCTQISLILKSGLLIADGVDVIFQELKDSRIKNVYKVIREELNNSVPLYKAMENSGYFPGYLVSMCHVGNKAGKLEEVMTSFSEYYEREEYVKIKIKNSIFFPIILFFLMSFVVILLVTKIFPIFEEMARDLGADINASSFISFSTGIAVGKVIMYCNIAIMIFITILFLIWHTQKGKTFIINIMKKMPLLRDINKKITAFRFLSSLNLLLTSGMNIDNSIDLLHQIVHNSELKNKIEIYKNSIKHGNNYITSLSDLALFSSMHIQMLNMGHRSGELDNIMSKLINIYENEYNQSISNAVSFIEPILVGILSIVIGIILISVMLPLMNIMSSIS